MKKLISITLLTALISITAQAKPQLERYFDKARLLTEKDFVFYDTIQFSLFDMSKIQLIQASQTSAEDANKIKSELTELPQIFYHSLKKQIYANEVPVTLTNKPYSYAKPLTLAVKIKEIHFKDPESSSSNHQDVTLKIFYELKNKTTDKVLLQTYDSATASYLKDTESSKIAFENIAIELMGDFTEYLHSLY